MRHRTSASELLAWALVGTAVGVAAGFALGGWLGPVRGRRLVRPAPDTTDPEAPVPGPGETARRVHAALIQDPVLGPLQLTPLAVAPGMVELHGWVPSRALRARAVRTVAALPGIASVVNCLLVQGEDDPAPDLTDLADQPA